jgi:hypothetical protein
MLQQLTAGGIVVVSLAAALAFAISYIWHRFFSSRGLPETLPWAGADGGYLSRARSTWKSFFGLREIIEDGYYRVSNIEIQLMA